MYNDIFKKIIVIGGNVAGLAAASQAKRIQPDLEITVLESGKYISYGSCGLSYYLSGEVKDFNSLFTYSIDFFKEKRDIDIKLNHKVVGIDLSKRELLINIDSSSNHESINYDKLIICTGSTAIYPDIKGIHAKNVFTFKDVKDTLSIKEYINSAKPQKAAIIGGGSIGLLVAESLNKLGIEVSIIEAQNKILGSYNNDISNILQKELPSKIKIFTNSMVNAIKRNTKNIANSISINTNNVNNEITADLVVLAIGAKANTDFLTDTSIELGINEAIKVTPQLKTSYPNIYAAGDCCVTKNIITGRDDYIPTASNAAKMGRIAGNNAAGQYKVFPGSTGTKVDRIFDFEVAKVGLDVKKAAEFGYDVLKITNSYPSHAKYISGLQQITISIILDIKTRKLLGAQMIGKEGVSKRIDIFSTAISNDMKVDDIYMLDLSYAPLVSTVWDPVNKICGKAVLELEKERF